MRFRPRPRKGASFEGGYIQSWRLPSSSVDIYTQPPYHASGVSRSSDAACFRITLGTCYVCVCVCVVRWGAVGRGQLHCAVAGPSSLGRRFALCLHGGRQHRLALPATSHRRRQHRHRLAQVSMPEKTRSSAAASRDAMCQSKSC